MSRGTADILKEIYYTSPIFLTDEALAYAIKYVRTRHAESISGLEYFAKHGTPQPQAAPPEELMKFRGFLIDRLDELLADSLKRKGIS